MCVIQSIKKHGFHITSKERYFSPLNKDKKRFEMRSFNACKIVDDILRADNASKEACIKQTRHQKKSAKQTNKYIWHFGISIDLINLKYSYHHIRY